MEPLSTLIVFALHVLFGFSRLSVAHCCWHYGGVLGHLQVFAAKSEMTWRVTLISWIISFVVGVFIYVAVTTTLL